MSIDRRLLNWGLFLVILGFIPLAVNQGWIARETLSRAWQLWPLLLIGSGIGLILSRTRLAFLGGLVVAATFGIILGSLVVGGFGLTSIGCGSSSASGPVLVNQQGAFGSRATVDLRVSCGALTVAPTPGGWSLNVTGDERTRPQVSSGPDTLSARSPDNFAFIPFDNGRAASWNVGLPVGVDLEIRLQINATDARLDGAGMRFTSLNLEANAGSTRLDLSAATVSRIDAQANASDLRLTLPLSGATGVINANAASVHLCAAPGANLRLTTADSHLSSDNFKDRGLVRTGDTWTTAGAPVGAPVIDLRLEGNAVGFTLEGLEGCR